MNCKRTGHSKEDCFQKGGGKEGQAPWDKKKDGDAKANAATAEDDVSLAVTCHPDQPLEVLTSFPAAQNAIIDCGATQHFTPNRADLTNFTEIPPKPIKVANRRILQATGRGDLKILLLMGKDQPTKATLQNVYYSPDFIFTLISVGTMDRKGYQIDFDDGFCTIRMPKPNRHTIGLIPQANGLYCVSIAPQGTTNGPEEALAASGKITISELHRRMGHVNHEDLLKMVKEKTIIGIDLDLKSKPELCPQCIEAKATNRPFPKLSISN